MSHLAITDLNKTFANLPTPPFIANELNIDSEENKRRVNLLVYTHYDGESLKLTPSCECGHVKGEYRIGELCRVCNTYCTSRYSGETQSLLWVTSPKDIGGFIIPVVWLQLRDIYRTDGVDVIRYITDPYYRPSKRLPEVLNRYNQHRPRSYKHFIHNFDDIINELSFKANGKLIAKYETIYRLIKENRDKIIVQALPIPSKTLLVVEKNKSDRYFDKNLMPAGDAVIIATEMGALPPDAPSVKFETKMVKIIDRLATFFENFSTKQLTGKRSIPRKHFFAARVHFSARQVITSNFEPHQADELVLPWTAMIGLFTEHIRSKLLKPPYNMGIYEISDILRKAANTYCPIIEEVLETIIKVDTPYKGVPCTFARPPVMTRGSIQFFYITNFLRNPDINVIKISPLVLVMPNADFDGDAMHVTLLPSGALHDAFKVLAPAFTILDPNTPNALSDAIKMPPPIVATINNWFLETDLKLQEYQNNESKDSNP